MTSERVDQLDPQAEVFYRRLLSKVDDHGLYDARPSILRASLFPLRLDRVREADCTRWLAACQKAGLLVLYEAENKPYLKAMDTRWQARSDPKYPLPPQASANNCAQMPAAAPVVVDVAVVESVVVGRSAFAPPDWIPAETWKAFEEHRKKLRKPMTDKARSLIVAELEKLRHAADPGALLDQSIRNGWQDVFPLKDKSAHKGNGHDPAPSARICSACKTAIPIGSEHVNNMHPKCWEAR